MKHGVATVFRLCAVSLLLPVVGCAGALPGRYPSRPPSAMSPAQAEQDERACVDTAGRATVQRAWAYIGCMVSKNHSVGMASHARLWVTQTKPHDASTVVSELDRCRETASAASKSGGGGDDVMLDRMERAFRACVDPLGYKVERLATPPPR